MKCLMVAITPWLLHALDVADGHAPGQERVLAEVLEVAAVHGRGVDVDARAEHEVNAARAGIAADGGADALGQRRIPGGRQPDAARMVVAGPRCARPSGHRTSSASAARRRGMARI